MRNYLPIGHFPPTLFSPNRPPIYERHNYFSQPAAKRVEKADYDYDDEDEDDKKGTPRDTQARVVQPGPYPK